MSTILLWLSVVCLVSAFISVNTDFEDYFSNLLVVSAFLFLIGLGVAASQHEGRQKAEAKECVQNGGEWIRYSDAGFVCVENKLE